VLLTFDGVPNNTYATQALDVLKAKQVHAVFFGVGYNMANYPSVTRRIVAEGHWLGNGGYLYHSSGDVSKAKLQDEIHKTQVIAQRITQTSPSLFRPVSQQPETTATPAAAANGLTYFGWTVDPRVWARPGVKALATRVVAGASPGAVVRLEASNQEVVAALPAIIDGLRQKGYVVGTD
jgi:peptidoglycan/xylan/chitin deacetylase (PgdA/CDA1 family)